jgi:hypothetical protein
MEEIIARLAKVFSTKPMYAVLHVLIILCAMLGVYLGSFVLDASRDSISSVRQTNQNVITHVRPSLDGGFNVCEDGIVNQIAFPSPLVPKDFNKHLNHMLQLQEGECR